MRKVVQTAGKVLRQYFKTHLQVKTKQTATDYLTKADISADRVIIRTLKENFPDHGLISEESGSRPGKKATFIIDPLDGTNNFVHGITSFYSVIALVVDNQIVAATVFDPILKENYWAVKGFGAYLGNERIKVDKSAKFQNCILANHQDYLTGEKHQLKVMTKLYKAQAGRILTSWSVVDFLLLAQGLIGGIVGRDKEPHDALAGLLITKEAGAKISRIKGSGDILKDRQHYIIASNKVILNKLEGLTRSVLK